MPIGTLKGQCHKIDDPFFIQSTPTGFRIWLRCNEEKAIQRQQKIPMIDTFSETLYYYTNGYKLTTTQFFACNSEDLVRLSNYETDMLSMST